MPQRRVGSSGSSWFHLRHPRCCFCMWAIATLVTPPPRVLPLHGAREGGWLRHPHKLAMVSVASSRPLHPLRGMVTPTPQSTRLASSGRGPDAGAVATVRSMFQPGSVWRGTITIPGDNLEGEAINQYLLEVCASEAMPKVHCSPQNLNLFQNQNIYIYFHSHHLICEFALIRNIHSVQYTHLNLTFFDSPIFSLKTVDRFGFLLIHDPKLLCLYVLLFRTAIHFCNWVI